MVKKTLSDERIGIFEHEAGVAYPKFYYYEKDVKEFIKKCVERMEKKLELNKIKYQDVVQIIKEELGEKLTK